MIKTHFPPILTSNCSQSVKFSIQNGSIIAQTKSKIMRIEVLSFEPNSNKTIPTFTVIVKPSLVQRVFGHRNKRAVFKRIGNQWVEYQPDNVRFKCDTQTCAFFDLLESEMLTQIAQAN